MTPALRARRVLPPSLLALILAIGTVAGAAGRDAVPPTASPDGTIGYAVATPTGAVLAVDSAAIHGLRPSPDGGLSPRATGSELVSASDPAMLVGIPGERPTPALPAVKPSVEPKGGSAAGASGSGGSTSTADYHGRNHVWMPALGIDRSVSGYACSNKSYPGNRVYRWGCAGSNNIYLFGHAHSVFKSLHDAYVKGKLKKGQQLFYADGNGTVHRYTVSWWKVTTPTKGTWAYAAQSSPSLTLQTCVGSDSQYRLIVRLSRDD